MASMVRAWRSLVRSDMAVDTPLSSGLEEEAGEWGLNLERLFEPLYRAGGGRGA
ncbi:hypothetical protein D3C78_1899570 [compost metagenome]